MNGHDIQPPLTIDNVQLSAVKADSDAGRSEVLLVSTSCMSPSQLPADIDERVSRYIRDSLSSNSIRAYSADVRAFLTAGGAIPANPEFVARHLAAQAGIRSVATLTRRLVAIGKAHSALGLPNPCDSEIVRATLRGIRRTHGATQRQVEPLLREDLLNIISQLPSDIRGARDRALLLVGFAAALRRSEVAAIRVEDVRYVAEGLVLRLPRSKSDQEGIGRDIGVPLGRSRACPVKALRAWLEVANISTGPVFRSISKAGRVAEQAITGAAVAAVLKKHAERVGLDPELYSGHSLRSGLLTSAAKAGVSSWKLRQQSGHKSDSMLARYIRDGNLFIDNAAGAVL